MDSLNIHGLSNRLASSSGLSVKQASSAIQLTLQAITAALAAGHEVNLQGFGIFRLKPIQAHTRRNPHTGEIKQIPATQRVEFGNRMKL